eukprot:GHVN01026746.1.p1 GENE.GHVN01026746.1~~GHVN01026746.1.p1  ORF type:complete len:135 (-),score=15.38 GHVN01026746.1:779-1183(-)
MGGEDEIFDTALQRMRVIEEQLKREHGGELPPQAGNLVYAAGQDDKKGTPAKVKPPPTQPCWSCGEMHWKKDCPHKQTLGKKCKKKGHLTTFCRTEIYKDQMGKPRVEVTPTRGGNAEALFKSDQYTSDQLETV